MVTLVGESTSKPQMGPVSELVELKAERMQAEQAMIFEVVLGFVWTQKDR
jgi:hypothetical protein